MKIVFDIDEKYDETTITIQCKEINQHIEQIVSVLKRRRTDFIIGKKANMNHILEPTEIHFFRANGDKIEAVTSEGTFQIREKLYEIEQMLPANQFIRISKSVIVNIHELSKFEASFNGTLCVYFKSGEKEYVYRNYVKQLRQILQMNRRDER